MGMKLIWGGRVISGLLACLLAMSAAMKLVGGIGNQLWIGWRKRS